MIINLHSLYKNAGEFSEGVLKYIRQGYSLICVWIENKPDDYIIEPQQSSKCFMGYYIYSYDQDKNLLQIREEISKDVSGAIEVEDNATQVSLLDEHIFKNMLYNAYPDVKKFKNTSNPFIGDYTDDFFVQWNLESEEPDRVILVEPHENYLNKTYNKKSANIIGEYLLNWANKYPYYCVNLSFEYRMKINRFNYMKQMEFLQEITDHLYYTIPTFFTSKENYLCQYLMILKTKLGSDFVETINKLYVDNRVEFDTIFSVEYIEQELFRKQN